MLHHCRSFFAAAATVVALSLALASSASAVESIAFNTYPTMPSASGTMTFTAGGLTVRCPITLSGTLAESQIALVSGATVAQLTRTTIGTCEGASGVSVLALPWAMTFRSLEGTLQERVTRVNYLINSFAVTGRFFLGVTCLYGGTIEAQVPITGSNPYTAERVTLRGTLSKRSGSELCPGSATADESGIWSTIWNILFEEVLPMTSRPAWVTKALATPSTVVAVIARQPLTVQAIGFERALTGWSFSAPANCIRVYAAGDSCNITIEGTNATAYNRLLLRGPMGETVGSIRTYL